DPLELFIEGGIISIKKYNPGCEFCGNVIKEFYYKKKFICRECAFELQSVKELKGTNELVTSLEIESDIAVATNKQEKKSKIRPSTLIMVEKYIELNNAMPHLKQIEIADILGVKQARVSQLKKIAADYIQNNEDKIHKKEEIQETEG
ncbi:hypothetical protein, partial [Mycobacterium tuberculosis]